MRLSWTSITTAYGVAGCWEFAGWCYSATNTDHVGYESWLERDRLILLDADPEVTGIASQPFWLHRHDGVRQRRHAPDYFVRLADGRGRVIDVRADDQIDEAGGAGVRGWRAGLPGGGLGFRAGPRSSADG
ncbi:TnsA-like heteromeric transposase endonuclease subunit [Nonomuraea sp. LP-02]|uniref:TnsA-like heteromeric transposase endonuclease subunit n=1 Tax=Nonomuraea sp. LP-02 TaxID=3097960 RepID=UPI003FA5639D